ncbi:MAG: 4-hydroxythreonine-4-phosphate dehydrogenase PdxA [Deltaproteobacteria bacterium]|nr:4-hydroxythreonine-4-phosphate dehydrogenase PdxA [Deltaproteobacteria bacterium]
MSSAFSIAVTQGDPLGIGPEVTEKALLKKLDLADWKVFGDPSLMPSLPPEIFVSVSSPSKKLSAKMAGELSVSALEKAMAAWKHGEVQALVTAPIAKSHVHLAGFPFPGHTEFLAEQTGRGDYAMMMAGKRLKVILVTIHHPLKEVPSLLSSEKIFNKIKQSYLSLKKDFGLSHPRLAILGLNPHAGEEGLLGREEEDIIKPALEKARLEGLDCQGPLVPDVAFVQALQGKWDALICLYHDQGLIPFKMIHFKDGVNVTLGLPLVRTSPDHGTAFDIAGQGIADSSSMEAAMDLCVEILKNRQKQESA